MTTKRYIKRMWEEEYYIFDSNTISESDFEEKLEYQDYKAFEDSMMGDEVVNRLNELHEENQLKLEMVDAFIRGLEDEKGIVPEDREFQCRMNHTIKVLKELKRDMFHPSEFKRLRELEE